MTVKTDNIQIGNNPTSSQNFIISQAADGTGKLTRQSGGDIITWDSAGKITFPLPPIHTQYSMVRLNTANGYGSTNTMIRRFTTVVTNQGSDITYADSATLGASFTINTNGVYAISYSDCFGAASDFGISINSAQLTTVFISITISDRVFIQTTNTGFIGCAAGSIYLPAGSVIRPHAAGAASSGTSQLFTITRVS